MDTTSIQAEGPVSGGYGQKNPSSFWNEKIITAILFLTPTILMLAVFVVWPILSTLRLSLFDWNGIDPTQTFVGLENWARILNDDIFIKAFGNNILIVVLSIVIQIPIAMLLAIFLDRYSKLFISKFFKTIYFLPLLMSSVAIGILFKFIYDPSFGPITMTLKDLGLNQLVRPWLADPDIAIYSIIAVVCWQFIPFYMVLFLAALTSIPSEMRDAALLDGATEAQFYARIAVPMIQGTMRTSVILSLIGSLKYFDLIWVMTQGGPFNSTELMATYMYKKAFVSADMGYGATVASAMFIIVMVISSVVFYASRRFETEV
ncbi:sugar ABC transporter permease [Phototrophicus methaneseepsis]|uniref:Sugar ABC transporter permease n=1 Tax=Phototrophicus methaneseepsis TaxID=2710758 RepID=A0A7S8ED02_9CHLR|nr:sugar ABC transporter permease [Phototrophicus methaneseepsis]QPC84574.1 sugar ABC transporter permease [Phototrophicus methaneseepsis]